MLLDQFWGPFWGPKRFRPGGTFFKIFQSVSRAPLWPYLGLILDEEGEREGTIAHVVVVVLVVLMLVEVLVVALMVCVVFVIVVVVVVVTCVGLARDV